MHLEIIAGHKTALHTLSAMVIACNLLDEKYVPQPMQLFDIISQNSASGLLLAFNLSP